jgi:hydroxymethylpyrimidine pyrophosphatase-like HAD family hydrolase
MDLDGTLAGADHRVNAYAEDLRRHDVRLAWCSATATGRPG